MDNDPDEPPPSPPFVLVPLRPRRDGWTPERQIAFVEALATSACVDEACRAVGMSARSAYALRSRPRARSFRGAWDAALDLGMQRLEQAAFGRALHGVARPVFYRGEQVGEWREYDERLAMFLLRYRRPVRFGAALDHLPAAAGAVDEAQEHGEPEMRLDACLDFLNDLTDSNDEDDAEDPDSPINVGEGP